MPKRDVTFDQPVKAELVIELENGVKLPATQENLQKFGYVDELAVYCNFRDHLYALAALEGGNELPELLVAIRHIAELAITAPNLLNDSGAQHSNDTVRQYIRGEKSI